MDVLTRTGHDRLGCADLQLVVSEAFLDRGEALPDRRSDTERQLGDDVPDGDGGRSGKDREMTGEAVNRSVCVGERDLVVCGFELGEGGLGLGEVKLGVELLDRGYDAREGDLVGFAFQPGEAVPRGDVRERRLQLLDCRDRRGEGDLV